MDEKVEAFRRILTIMDELREGCPWDRVQTWESLRSLTIEETFELADAIIDNDEDGVSEELGDMLLHLVFYARIGDEKGAFDIVDVITQVCDKLVHRHPHIYGDAKVDTEEEVKQNWEKLKLEEKKNGAQKRVLSGVPRSLPALIKGLRVQEKAGKVGFEWESREDVWKKVEEETGELHEAVQSGDASKQEEEFGDLMFALVNYARYIDVDPEAALEKANRKFIRRFNYVEEQAMDKGRELDGMTLEEMDKLWDEAKTLE